MLTLVAVAGAAAAAYLAIHSGLNAGATGGGKSRGGSHRTSFGSSSVLVTHPSGRVCYRVIEPSGSSHGCRPTVKPTEIAYTISPHAIGGVAGADVTAVIAKLTRRGTKWAKLRDGVFYADVPAPYRVRTVIKVIRGGTRETFHVTQKR